MEIVTDILRLVLFAYGYNVHLKDFKTSKRKNIEAEIHEGFVSTEKCNLLCNK